MDLLDPLIEHYVLHEKDWKSGGGDICNPQGETIGIVRKKNKSMKNEFQLLNSDRTLICIINKKVIESSHNYDVKTPSGKLIARGRKPIVSVGNLIDMYDSEDNLIYKAQGSTTKWNFKIIDPKEKNKIYAEVKSGTKWREIFAPEFNFKNRYVVHIVDTNASKLILLAYAIIINDVYHDKLTKG